MMKVLIQNLQKRPGLATKLYEEHKPNILMVQELNYHTERSGLFPAKKLIGIGKSGYGTAIGSEYTIANIKKVIAPYPEIGGLIRKRTTIATIKGVQWISMHAYNGQPFKDKHKLVAHVEAVLNKLEPGPAVFAGDFNTWSKVHLDAVKETVEKVGFRHVYSWPYNGRDLPLDHVFIRGDIRVKKAENFVSPSDHRGAILELEIL